MSTTTKTRLTAQAEPALKVAEVAEHLRCDPSKVYGLIRDGALRHVRVGRLIRVPESAITEFLNGGGAR